MNVYTIYMNQIEFRREQLEYQLVSIAQQQLYVKERMALASESEFDDLIMMDVDLFEDANKIKKQLRQLEVEELE